MFLVIIKVDVKKMWTNTNIIFSCMLSLEVRGREGLLLPSIETLELEAEPSLPSWWSQMRSYWRYITTKQNGWITSMFMRRLALRRMDFIVFMCSRCSSAAETMETIHVYITSPPFWDRYSLVPTLSLLRRGRAWEQGYNRYTVQFTCFFFCFFFPA